MITERNHPSIESSFGYKYVTLFYNVVVMGFEPICDQLLFLQGISLRRYTTILPASERQDLNLRPPAPKAGALPTAPLSDEPPIGLEPTTV